MSSPNLHHLAASHQDTKWKQSTSLCILAVMQIHPATVCQSFSEELAWPQFFGDVRRMEDAANAHQTLHLSVLTQQDSGQLGTWRRQ